jgi:hypothetical protein
MASASAWHLAQRQELATSGEEVHVFQDGRRKHVVVSTPSALWLVSEWGKGARLACRLAFSPTAGLRVDAIRPPSDDSPLEIAASSSIGEQVATVVLHNDHTVSATTTLRVADDLTIDGWPRDVLPDLSGTTEGMVHTSQRGLRTGLLHASMTEPAAGSFMFLQDLTELGEYCDTVHASAADTVGGEWPDVGFALPSGEEPLPRGSSVVISAWKLALADEVPDEPVAVADQYLDLLSRLYFHLDRPEPDHVDWAERAIAARADLEQTGGCWLEIDGRRYLRAYVGDDNHPPESMVQLAVLVPLLERTGWSPDGDALIDDLRGLLPSFRDERTGMIARWLPSAENLLDGGEEHEGPRIMDSWYLFHPLLNLARLAEHGDDEARDMLLESLDRVIEIAHRFTYDWPVFYDIDTLEIIKAESEEDQGGERDVPGLYAHVMLQAHELTGDQRYLDEAIAAAAALRDGGFDLAYQTNNVAFGMIALLRLHHITGDTRWLDISRVLAACLFDNVGLWSIRYGWGSVRSTFCAVFPMPDAPYTAAYEEAEVAGAAAAYLREAGDALAPALAVLLPELIRHVTAKLDAYYPPHIPRDALTDAPKTGRLEADTWIPVEDVGDGFEPAGTVGQEVYGAGIAFSTAARTFGRIEGSDVEFSCEYPFEVIRTSTKQLRLRVHGDPRLKARLRLTYPATDGQPRRWRDHWIAAGGESSIPLEYALVPSGAR